MAIHKRLGPAWLIAAPGVEWSGTPAPIFAAGAPVGTSYNVTSAVRDYNPATDTITVVSGTVAPWCSFNGTAFTVVSSPASIDDFGPITLRCARIGVAAANSQPFNVVVSGSSDIIFNQGTARTEDISGFYAGFNPAYHETVQAAGAVPSGVSVLATAGVAYNGTGPASAVIPVTIRGRHKTLQPPALVATVGTAQPQALDLHAYCLGAGITGARTYALNASSSALPPGWSISMNRYMAYNGSGAAGSAANVIIDATDSFGNSQTFTVDIEGTGPAANTVVGVSGGSFTINGVPTFLLAVSYFDVMNYKVADLDYMAANGWNACRVWGEMWAGGSGSRVIDANGNIIGLSTIRQFCLDADARGIVVQFVILDWESSPISAAPLTAITNIVNALKDLRNIIWDCCNEHNHTGTYDDHSGVAVSTQNMRNTAKAADPTCILTVSSCSDHPHFFDSSGNTINNTMVDAELDITNVDYLQPHCERSTDWYDQTGPRVAQLVARCAARGKVRPIALFEENRRNGSWGQPTQANFEQAAQECLQAGGGGWLLHNNACFDNRNGTFESRLDSVERATIVSLPPLIFGGGGPVDPGGFTLIRTGRVGPQYCGGNDHLGQGFGNPAGLAQATRNMHCHALRDGIVWNIDEPEGTPGVYGFKPSGGSQLGADLFTFFANQAAAGWDCFYHAVMAYFWNYNYSGYCSDPTFRQYIVNWCKNVVNQWIAAGRNPARLVLNMGNESNSDNFGDYHIADNDGLGVQNYGILCREVRNAVRAINPAVRIQVGEGVNGASPFYATWTTNLFNTPNFWTQSADVISVHPYQVVFPDYAEPEELYAELVPYAQRVLNDAAAAGRTDITVAVTEGGYTLHAGDDDAYQTKALPRTAFLYSVVPGMEFIILYALRDNGEGFSWIDHGTFAINANRGLALRDAFEHIGLSTSRAHYGGDGANGDVAIVMEVPSANGGRRAALWNLGNRALSSFQVTANQIGTLRLQKTGGGTSTRALAAGTNTLTDIPLDATPTVLHTTDGTIIDFPQLYLPSSGGGTSGFTLKRIGRVGPQYCGGNDHLGQGYGNPTGIAQATRNMHCHALRDGIVWDFDEPNGTPGVYGFKPSGGSQFGADIFTFFANQAAAGWDCFYHAVMAYFWNWNYARDPVNPLADPAYRQLIVNWCKNVVNQWIAAGRNPARLVLNMGNESNSDGFGEYGIAFNDGLGVQNYGILCREVRTAVRAINPAVRVQVGEGADGANAYYAEWTNNLFATPNFWTQSADIISVHPYHFAGEYPVYGEPEELHAELVPYAQRVLNDAAAAGRTDITLAVTEGGYTINQHTDAYQTNALPRTAFLYSVVPGVEFIILYALRDSVEGFGWLDGSLNIIANRGNALRDAFLHLGLATSRAHYEGDSANGDVGIIMEVPAANGGRRVALWNLAGRTLAGLQCTANQNGTLRLHKMGGSTTTRTLAAGTNTLADIPLNDTPTVLHATDGTIIDFPQLYLPSSGGGTSSDADFQYRRTRPGNVRSFGFDSTADLGGIWGDNYGVLPGTKGTVDIDTNTKASGGGSMRFGLLAGSGNNVNWFTNFWPGLTKLYGANSSFFIQFKVRLSQTVFEDWAHKYFLIGTGDEVGQGPTGSCTDLEIEMEPYANANGMAPTKQFPIVYNGCPGSCGGSFNFYENIAGSDYDMQNARPSTCSYQDPTHAGCKFFVPLSWMTFQVGVDIGPRITQNGHYWFQNSRVRLWYQTSPGAAEDLILDYIVGTTPGSAPGLCAGSGATGNQRYGKIWLLPYTQNNVANPRAGNVWFDEIIISEVKIPAAAA